MIFKALLDAQFYLKYTKCVFAQKQVDYLGHVVSGKGVEPEPSKIQAMLQWPTPTSVRELRGFLGLTGFYRKFVIDYMLMVMIYKVVIHYHEHVIDYQCFKMLDFKFQES